MNLYSPTAPPESGGLHPIILKELLELKLPEARWAVDGLVETGAVTMISAIWGQRKSWICQHIALCIAAGAPVFGRFGTKQQGVIIVNEEDNARQLQERMNILSPSSEDLPVFFLVGQGFRLDGKRVARLMWEAKKRSIGTIIIDSFRAVHAADENDSASMQKVMDQLKHLTQAGLTVILTHHNRKNGFQHQGDLDGEETRGSSAINAAVHGHLSVKSIKGEDGNEYIIVRQCKNKSAEKLAPFRVQIEKTDGHLSLVYSGEHLGDNSSTRTAETIMAALRAADRWMSVKDIEECGFARDKAIRVALAGFKTNNLVTSKTRKELEDDGTLSPTLEGQHNELLYAPRLASVLGASP